MVPLRESLLIRVATERELAYDRAALLHNLARELAVLLGIEPVERRPEHTDRAPACGESSARRLGVDAKRKARDDAPSVLRQIVCKPGRLVEPVRRRPPRADDRDGRLGENLYVAFHIQRQRMAARLLEKRRILFVDGCYNRHAVAPRLGELALPVDFTSLPRHLFGIALPRRSNIAAALCQTIDTHGAYAVRKVECDVCFALGHGRLRPPLAMHGGIMV